MKSLENATITSRSQLPISKEEDKNNACKINIQMDEKNLDQLSLPQASRPQWLSQNENKG